MSFIKDENGQGMVEYALIVALIAIVVIVALGLLGPAIANKFNNAATAVEGTSGS
jgi:pilus assembly protein Flp/PilA